MNFRELFEQAHKLTEPDVSEVLFDVKTTKATLYQKTFDGQEKEPIVIDFKKTYKSMTKDQIDMYGNKWHVIRVENPTTIESDV